MKLFNRLLLVLLVVVLCLPVMRTQAQDTFTGEFTTSGGLTVRFPESFSVEEYSSRVVSLVDEENEGLSIQIGYGAQALEDVPEDAIVEEVMELQLEVLDDNGFVVDTALQYTTDLENGTAIIQPYEFLDETALQIVVDLTEGSFIAATVFANTAVSEEQQELVLAILGTVSVDLAVVGDDAVTFELPEGARTLEEMPEGKILFALGAEFPLPEGWRPSDTPFVMNAVDLEADEYFATLIEVELYKFNSAEEVGEHVRNLLLVYATVGSDPNFDPDNIDAFAPALETVTLDGGKTISYYQNDLVYVAFIDLGDNYVANVAALTLLGTEDEESLQRIKDTTRFVAENFVLNPEVATVEVN